MKKIFISLIILSLSLGFFKLALVDAKPVLAADSPFGDQPDQAPNLSQIQFANSDQPQASQVQPVLPEINLSANDSTLGLSVLNTAEYDIAPADASAGKKFKGFNNQFSFQIDKDTFSTDAQLEVRELALGPQSIMAAPAGFQFASRIYEYNLTAPEGTVFKQPFWFSVRYLDDDYFRKTMYYFDEQKNQWVGLESLVSNTVSKIISHTAMTHAKVAILDNLNIMTSGIASWYRYKGCNCAASPDYPKGTKLKVTNVDNGKTVIVKVNDWGPDRSVFPDRVIDLDRVAFKKIAPRSAGLCKVTVELYKPALVLNK